MATPESQEASAALDFSRSLRVGTLIGGGLLGALVSVFVGVGIPAVPGPALLLVVFSFFAGVPLGYLSGSRAAAIRLAFTGAIGIAGGTLLAVLIATTSMGASPAEAALAAAVSAVAFCAVGFVALALGALLGRRAGTRRPRRREAPDEGEDAA